MAKYTINSNFATAIRQKSAPFAENGYELIFSAKATKDGKAYNGRVVASTKFNKSEVCFTYTSDEAPEKDVTVLLGKDFEKAIGSLGAIGKDFVMQQDGNCLEIKCGPAAVRVPVKEDGAVVTIPTPAKEKMIPCICGTGAFQLAIRRALSACTALSNETSETLTLLPKENHIDIYGSCGPVLAKAGVEVKPADANVWAGINGKTLVVKASELKSILPVLEGEGIRVFVAAEDQQLLIVSGHDIFSFRLLTKGIPMSEEAISKIFGLSEKASVANVATADFVKAINIATVLQKEDPTIVLKGGKSGLSVTDPSDKGIGMKVALTDKENWEDYEMVCSAPLLKAALAVCGEKVKILENPNPGKKGGAFLFLKGDGYFITILSKRAPEKKAEKKEEEDTKEKDAE